MKLLKELTGLNEAAKTKKFIISIEDEDDVNDPETVVQFMLNVPKIDKALKDLIIDADTDAGVWSEEGYTHLDVFARNISKIKKVLTANGFVESETF